MACMIKNKYQITYVLDLSPGCQELIDCGMLSGCHDFPNFLTFDLLLLPSLGLNRLDVFSSTTKTTEISRCANCREQMEKKSDD